MLKKIIFFIPIIILLVEYSFSAAEVVDPTLDANSHILHESDTVMNSIVKIVVDSYISNNTKALQREENSVITDSSDPGDSAGDFDVFSPGLSDYAFIPLNAVQYQSSDYFPLYPGSIWEYTVNGSSKDTRRVPPDLVKVNGVMTSVVKHKGGLREYYTSDSNGVLLHRLSEPVYIPNIGVVNLSATFIPPVKFADGIISTGQTFQLSGIIRTNNLPVVKIIKFPYDASFSFDAIENITIPAGNFDVLKISVDMTLLNETLSTTYYLAENIGIVKEVGDGYTTELSSFYYAELLSPSAGEIVPSGSTYPINWEASSDTAYFNLLYSIDNGINWNAITPDLITGTSYDWAVPSPNKNRYACLIKINGYDSNGVKKTSVISKPFTIEVVKLSSPDGGETLTSNTTWPITWNTGATKTPVAKIILKYTKNGGRTWKVITRITGSDPGTYDWNIPVVSKEKSKCRVKIILQDANGKVVGSDISDNYFTISP
jgi:hypothetical protein